MSIMELDEISDPSKSKVLAESSLCSKSDKSFDVMKMLQQNSSIDERYDPKILENNEWVTKNLEKKSCEPIVIYNSDEDIKVIQNSSVDESYDPQILENNEWGTKNLEKKSCEEIQPIDISNSDDDIQVIQIVKLKRKKLKTFIRMNRRPYKKNDLTKSHQPVADLIDLCSDDDLNEISTNECSSDIQDNEIQSQIVGINELNKTTGANENCYKSPSEVNSVETSQIVSLISPQEISELQGKFKENATETKIVELKVANSLSVVLEDLFSSKANNLLTIITKYLMLFGDDEKGEYGVEETYFDEHNTDSAKPNERNAARKLRKFENNTDTLVAKQDMLNNVSGNEFSFKGKRNKMAIQKLILKFDKNAKLIKFICPLCAEKQSDEYEFYKHWMKLHAVERMKLKNSIDLLNQLKTYKKCAECVEVMKGYDYIKNHFKLHNFMYDRDESCIICSLLYNSLINHVTKHKPYNCLCCSKLFDNKIDLDSHMIVHLHEINKNEDENKIRKCTICSNKFYSIFDNVLEHLIDHHNVLYNFITSGDVLKICVNTVESKITSYLDNQIIKRVTNNQKVFDEYLCLHCTDVYKDSKSFTEHLTSVHNDELECKICDKVLPTSRTFQMHMKRGIHSKPNPIEKIICPACKKVLNDIVKFRQHLKEHSDNEFNHFDCPICNQIHYNYFTLKRHLQSHVN